MVVVGQLERIRFGGYIPEINVTCSTVLTTFRLHKPANRDENVRCAGFQAKAKLDNFNYISVDVSFNLRRIDLRSRRSEYYKRTHRTTGFRRRLYLPAPEV